MMNIHYEKGKLIQTEHWFFFSLAHETSILDAYRYIIKNETDFLSVKIVSKLPDMIKIAGNGKIDRKTFLNMYKIFGSVQNILKYFSECNIIKLEDVENVNDTTKRDNS